MRAFIPPVMACAAAALTATAVGAQVSPPARPGLDSPELAALGSSPVGVADVELVQPGQADPLQGQDRPVVGDRHLRVKVWYPAAVRGKGTVYRSGLPGADGKDVMFTVPGIATPDAATAEGKFPLVILAHGYSNTPEALSWLGENLASKGYVVVAPAFRDPPISIRTAAAQAGPLARRPLDIAFVAAEVQRRARAGQGPFATKVANLKAVVAIAPARALRGADLWAAPGVGAITAPTLFIVGSLDRAVGYNPGVRTLFDQEVHASRYLLTFRDAGHSIALIGAPPEMRSSYWDLDWFEDPVWRKDRLIAIQTHFITAFLDRYVKGDKAKAAYIDGLVPDSNDGTWPDLPPGRYAGYSPGAPITVWKGFQPNKTSGMTFEFKAAE